MLSLRRLRGSRTYKAGYTSLVVIVTGCYQRQAWQVGRALSDGTSLAEPETVLPLKAQHDAYMQSVRDYVTTAMAKINDRSHYRYACGGGAVTFWQPFAEDSGTPGGWLFWVTTRNIQPGTSKPFGTRLCYR